MQRSLGVIQGHGPQHDKFYDHPFFGQLFLGSILYSIGFPDSFISEQNSAASLYLAPRVIMGLLAVFDTFLIYKISENRFGTKIGVFASLLFAVMPISWITRRILLDSLLLPFVLLSILLALYSQKSQHKTVMVFFSGVFLGIAILTKIPAFTMIPLIAYLVYSTQKSKKMLVFALVPAIIIPMIWPAYSISLDQFDYWQKGVLWQAQRENTGMHHTALSFGAIDPVLFGLGIAGFVYAGIRKNWFVIFWLVPFLIFLSVIGYTQYFHWIILLPIFCIAASLLISDMGKKSKLENKLPVIVILSLAVFGFMIQSMILGLNISENQFESASFASELARQEKIPILAGPQFLWIYSGVQGQDMRDYTAILYGKEPSNFILLADPHYHLDYGRGVALAQIYNSSSTVATFSSIKSNYNVYQYPYSSLGYNFDAGEIELKVFQRKD